MHQVAAAALLAIVPALAVSALSAAEPAAPAQASATTTTVAQSTGIGGEFAIAFDRYLDERISGVSNAFGLVIPVGQIEIILHHEQARCWVDAEGSATNVALGIQIDGLRLRHRFYRQAGLSASAMLGFGSAVYSFDPAGSGPFMGLGTTQVAPVYDLGLDLSLLSAVSLGVTTDLGLSLLYRHCPINDLAVPGSAVPIDDLSGFQLGMNIGIAF